MVDKPFGKPSRPKLQRSLPFNPRRGRDYDLTASTPEVAEQGMAAELNANRRSPEGEPSLLLAIDNPNVQACLIADLIHVF